MLKIVSINIPIYLIVAIVLVFAILTANAVWNEISRRRREQEKSSTEMLENLLTYMVNSISDEQEAIQTGLTFASILDNKSISSDEIEAIFASSEKEREKAKFKLGRKMASKMLEIAASKDLSRFSQSQKQAIRKVQFLLNHQE